MDNSWIPNGFDPETTFRIEVKIESYLNKQYESKMVYVKGNVFQWVVDSDKFSLCDFISDLADKISWGKCQKPKIWVFDKNESVDVELISESQIPQIFTMYEKERKITFLVVVCDLDGKTELDSDTPTYACGSSQPTSSVAIDNVGSHGCNITKQPDQFEGPNDYVGVDDEDMYGFEGDKWDLPKDINLDLETDTVHDEIVVDDRVECGPIIAYDPLNPKIELNALFPNVDDFRKALRHFAIKNEFEVSTVKSDRKRFRGECKQGSCPWRIHASRLQDNKTFMIKVLPYEHSCPSTTMVDGKMATKSWVSDMAGECLRKNPSIGAKEVQSRLEDEFRVKVSYTKAWKGRKAALEKIHGKWEDSFQVLYNFKVELEERCPGSIVVIDCKKVGDKMLFKRIFVALKPCIDGFLHGCRPYLGIDSTHLTGKYKGQLAAASAIDGHNWLYPVAYGVFGSETTKNWTWFMKQLKEAMGSLDFLAISSDASKGLASAVRSVFPHFEHRECMRHLMDNANKKWFGDVFSEHMWPAAMAYTIDECEAHLAVISASAPAAIAYLEKEHKQVWKRSKFSEITKCDYLHNNISESFNNWIKDLKDLYVIDLVDGIRQRIMVMHYKRRTVGSKFTGVVLPGVMKQLNAKSRSIGKVSINRSGDKCAEVSGLDTDGNVWRYAVHLDKHECTCREWQISGQPCIHAIAFICSIRGACLEDYVHDFFSVQRFRAAYSGIIAPISAKSKWIILDPGFKLYPPQLMIPGVSEVFKKRQRCKRCGELGHQARTCKNSVPEDAPSSSINKRKRTTSSQGRQEQPRKKRVRYS